MKRLLCLAFLLLLVVAVVKSESTIEYDENGNEYEVKRFNIESRQLNGGRRQCVEIRRKRSLTVVENKQEESDEEQNMAAIYTVSPEQVTNLNAGTYNDTDNVKDDDENTEGDEGMNDDVEANAGADADEDTNDIKDQEAISNEGETAPEAVVANEAVAQPNGEIVVLNADGPPSVNPNTHALFKLVPVQPEINHYTEEYSGYDNGEDDYDYSDDFHASLYNYEEEINPVTTTAIWSTGDDNSNDHQLTKTRPTNQRNKNRNRKRNQRKKIKNQHRRKLQNEKPDDDKHQKKPLRKKIPKKNQGHGKRKPTTKPKLDSGEPAIRKKKKPAKRPRPGTSSNYRPFATKVVRRRYYPIGLGNRKRLQQNLFQDDQDLFTRTVTMAGDGFGDEHVNCIIINKDSTTTTTTTTTTTPRPFWNILGRDADGRPIASGNYGKRKRVNVRLS